MCGICGVSPLNERTRKILPFMAYDMEARGDDSWGITDGTLGHIVKKLGPISKSWELPDWDQALVHTRNGTQGAVTIENQHPFVEVKEDGTTVIGVHNGIISNHEALNKKYEREYEVDSMQLFAHIAENRPMKEICGYGAMVWYEDEKLHFCKFNGGELHIGRLATGEIVYCSTLPTLNKATRMGGGELKCVYEFKNEYKYWVDINDEGERTLIIGPTMVFGNRSTYVTATANHDSPWTGFVGSGGGRSTYPFEGGNTANNTTDPPSLVGARNTYVTGSRTAQTETDGEEHEHIGSHSARRKELPNGKIVYMCLACNIVQVDKKMQLLCPACFKNKVAIMERTGTFDFVGAHCG